MIRIAATQLGVTRRGTELVHFVLEIINFLVLVWILKRFLYKPVLDVIARRRAGIEKTLADAEARACRSRKTAGTVRRPACRLGTGNGSRRGKRWPGNSKPNAAANSAELQSELEQEREKVRVAEASRQADALRKLEETALVQAARICHPPAGSRPPGRNWRRALLNW